MRLRPSGLLVHIGKLVQSCTSGCSRFTPPKRWRSCFAHIRFETGKAAVCSGLVASFPLHCSPASHSQQSALPSPTAMSASQQPQSLHLVPRGGLVIVPPSKRHQKQRNSVLMFLPFSKPQNFPWKTGNISGLGMSPAGQLVLAPATRFSN
jgi:hypothetical protein